MALDYKYVRGQPPAFPESKEKYLEQELQKIEKQSHTASERFTVTEEGVKGLYAEVSVERSVRIEGDEAIAQRIETIVAGSVATNARITNEATARATADSALASQISSVSATVNSNTSAITNEATARATADSALASQLTTLSSTVGSNTTSIATAQSSVDGVKGRYGVTINNNGHVSGISLLSDSSNGTPTSVFRISAEQFAIRTPGTSTDSIFWNSSTSKLIVRGDIEATSVTAGSVNNNGLTQNSVNTTNIIYNAVNVPKVDFRPPLISGTGGSALVGDLFIFLKEPGWIYAIFTANQTYGTGVRTSLTTLNLAGHSVSVGGAAVTTNIAVALSKELSAGEHRIQVFWYGEDSGVRIESTNLFVMGIMR